MVHAPPVPDFTKPEYSPLINTVVNGCCIFLGAGFSKLIGFKTWNELADKLVEIFWNEKQDGKTMSRGLSYSIKKNLKKRNDKIVTLDYLYHLNKELFYCSIEKIFEDDKRSINYQPIEIIKPLINDSRNILVQTNLDKSVQEASNINEKDICINPYFGLEDRKMSYLHGRIDKRDSWIFTQGQYIKYYLNDKSNLMNFLLSIFKKYSVVFIGYSLRDYEILQAIANARINSNDPKEHFVFLPTYTEKDIELIINENIYNDNYGMKLVKYNIEETGYGILEKVLSDFMREVDKRKESKMYLGDRSKIAD